MSAPSDERPTSPGLLRAAGIALTAPLWTGGPRLQSLTGWEGPDETGRPGEHAPVAEAPRAVEAGWVILAALSRIPLSPWKNSCLQRSVVACRCLRSSGEPAVVRIGVRREPGSSASIEAHAWVELRSTATLEGRDSVSGYRRLRTARRPD